LFDQLKKQGMEKIPLRAAPGELIKAAANIHDFPQLRIPFCSLTALFE